MGNLIVTLLLAALPAAAADSRKIRVCVNPNNQTSELVLLRARTIASRMFSTAGVAVEWRCAGTPVVVLNFAAGTPADQHRGALAYASVYEAVHIIVLFDRIEAGSDGPTRASTLLAHVMTHEITHLLQGIARHSETGVMKERWGLDDLARRAHHPLPFSPEDVELIQRGLLRPRKTETMSVFPGEKHIVSFD